jgi:hypothetical protein
MKKLLSTILVAALPFLFLPDVSAQILRGRFSGPAIYYEMGCDCRHCVAGRGGTYAQVFGPEPVNSSAPSPSEVVSLALALADVKPYDLLYDIGSGDGRVLESAVRDYGCRAVGIEVSPSIASSARERLNAVAALPRRWRVVTGDAMKFDLSKATVAYLYLYPETLKKIVPRLKGCTRIISYMHPIPGYDNQRYETSHGPIYLVGWEELAAAANGRAAAVIPSQAVVNVGVCRT